MRFRATVATLLALTAPTCCIEARRTPVEADGCTWDGTPLPGACKANTILRGVAAGATSAKQCERLCCGAAMECVTWQYRDGEGCKLMGDVRVGPQEHSTRNTVGYCEETAPAPWSGRQLATRRPNGGCDWHDWVLEGQCWNLGRRQTISENSEKACADACCAEPTCGIYQWRQDKGCFYTRPREKPRQGCDEPSLVPYQGGRKVIPSGCKVHHGAVTCEPKSG